MSAEPKPPRNHPAIEAAFRAVAPELVAEIVNGQLHVSPRPMPRHARAAGELHGELRDPFDRGKNGPGGWVILDEPELHVGTRPDKLVPDLAGWRRERVVEGVFDAAAITLVPDWICEVPSEATEVNDRVEKMPIYARQGVPWVWLIEPASRVLEVFRLESGEMRQTATHRADARVRVQPFDAVELDLGALWRW